MKLNNRQLQKLKDKYPDVDICNEPKCDLNLFEHEAFYKYQQKKEDAKKTGEVLIYYEAGGNADSRTWKKFGERWNGKEWVRVNINE